MEEENELSGAEAVQLWAALFIAGILGHLIGDYVVQTNRMAQNKANPLFVFNVGRFPGWDDAGFRAITAHALTWAVAVWMCMNAVAYVAWGPSGFWPVLWACLSLGAIHWIQDRRWPVKWLMKITGHDPECTWLLIVFDNTLHLVEIALAVVWIVWMMW